MALAERVHVLSALSAVTYVCACTRTLLRARRAALGDVFRLLAAGPCHALGKYSQSLRCTLRHDEENINLFVALSLYPDGQLNHRLGDVTANTRTMMKLHDLEVRKFTKGAENAPSHDMDRAPKLPYSTHVLAPQNRARAKHAPCLYSSARQT